MFKTIKLWQQLNTYFRASHFEKFKMLINVQPQLIIHGVVARFF